MGRITTGVGLVSGINTSSIIDQLMAIESRPKTLLQSRIDANNQQKLAWADISARLVSLNLSASTLRQISTFQQAKATSTDENVITGTTGDGAAPGTYQFQVARLVTSQQSVSNGFSTVNDKVGAGTVTVELGGGEVYSQTALAQLNGGNGVRRGSFRITDRGGRSGIIDISTAMTLDDVVQKINTSLDVSVRAEVKNDRLVLTDQSGATAQNLVVADLGAGHAAEDLGIEGTAAGGTLTGQIVNTLGRATGLAQLNDGRGVRTVAGLPDLRITAADGSTFDVTLSGLNTVGSVLDAINTATGGKVTATTSGKGIVLTDSSGGGGTLATSALNGSNALHDLGLDIAASGNTISGRKLLAGFDSVLLSALRGGSGVSLGSVSITDRAGHNATIDLSGANDVQDIIDAINNNGVAQISASLKDSGNGIQLSDTSGGTGNLVISDVGSTTAAQLGIAGTFTTSAVNGANLQRQWVSENMLLSAYNGGKGVMLGKFRITNSQGQTASIDLSSGNVLDIGDVLNKINSATIPVGNSTQPLGVTASINANGDGILLTDTAGGAQGLTVQDDGGTTATDLNIKGSGAGGVINGSFERTYAVGAGDTLSTVVDALNAPGFALSAQIINDGSSGAPYRLSITSRNSGRAGRVVFDAGATSLSTQNLVEGQDAVVFYGGTGGNSLVISSSSNQIKNIVKGLTLDLHSASNNPVTISVTRTADNIVSELKKFADNYNGLVDKLKDDTKYDSSTNTKGVLLGEGGVGNVEMEMQAILYATVSGVGNYRSLIDVGLTASGTDGHLQLNEDQFNAAFQSNPDAIKSLFTMYVKGSGTTPDKKGLAALMQDHLNNLIDPVTGAITLENQTLDNRTQDFQDRMKQLDDILASKRARLQQQFTNMETVLAKLQSQQSALSGLAALPIPSYTTSSSSTSPTTAAA